MRLPKPTALARVPVMTYTIETRAPGSTEWRLAPFSIKALEHGHSIFGDLSKGLNVKEVRLLEDGVVLACIGRFNTTYPNPQNLPGFCTLAPSDLPMWVCPAVTRRQHTADSALFLWRNGLGMWNAGNVHHLQGYLRRSSVDRIRDDAEDLQLVLASGTADKLQQVLVGYVTR